MSALVFMILLACGGACIVWDGWGSIIGHWKRDGQTFWKDQLYRLARIGWGLTFIWMAWSFGVQILGG